MSILSIALLLFIVLDPFGNMVTLNTLLGALPAARRRVLTASPTLFAFLGRRRALALERLMGILLVMLSVQMVLDGVGAYLTSRGAS